MSDTKDAYQRFVSEWMSKHPGHAPTSRAAWDAAIAHSQAAPTQALLGWTRYEKARKLNPAQWAELHQRNLRGGNFDDMIDALPVTTMTQQEGWTYDKNGSGKWEPVQQDALYDSAYIAGAKAGHNAAQSDDPEALDKLIASRDGYLKGLKPVQQDTAELVSDDRIMWQWNRIDDCLHGRLSVIWFARAVIDDYRAATTPPAEKQAAPSGEDNHG